MKEWTREEMDQPIRDQFNSLIFETREGEKLAVCMRDSGYEFNYQGVWYEAKEGKVAPLGNLHAYEVVQPSAVVGREWPFCPECGSDDSERGLEMAEDHRFCKKCGQEWFTTIDYSSVIKKHLTEWFALQLPQPVAPVQSGGVDICKECGCLIIDGKCWCEKESVDAQDIINELEDACFESMGGGWRERKTGDEVLIVASSIIERHFAHLTTTQSVPSVGSVPTVELELLKRFKGFVVETILPNARNVSLDVVEELAWSSIVQEVDALLTSRTEGK